MPLKVVPAGDERCDIHTHRTPARFVCESCLERLEVREAQPRARRRSLRARIRRARRRLRRGQLPADPKVLIGAVAGLVAIALLVVALAGGGGDGGSEESSSGPPTQADVVNALGLVPDASGTGWTTPDGACWVVAIQLGKGLRPGRLAGRQLVQATNEGRTIGAAIAQGDLTVSEARCVARIGAALRARF